MYQCCKNGGSAFARFLKKKYFWKSEKSTFAQKGACIFGKCEITIGIWGNKHFFQEYFLHRIFKICLARSCAMIPTLDPYRATQGRQSKHKGQRKGDKANTRGNTRGAVRGQYGGIQGTPPPKPTWGMIIRDPTQHPPKFFTKSRPMRRAAKAPRGGPLRARSNHAGPQDFGARSLGDLSIARVSGVLGGVRKVCQVSLPYIRRWFNNIAADCSNVAILIVHL